MKKRILWTIVAVIAFVVVGSLYLAIATASDLLAARRALQGSVEDLDRAAIERARDNVASASDRLDGVLASTIGWVPVIGQNLRGLEAVADGAYPVLDSALDLRTTADEIDKEDLVQNGRVRLDLIERLRGPLEAQSDAIVQLWAKLGSSRSGWLLPPLYDEMTDLMERAEDLKETAGKAAAATRLAPDMLGGNGPRTYLVVLINNAELRGAGGILSGAGTVTMVDGAIRLGEFAPYADLGTTPYEKVKSPPEFARRFGFAKADTTLWVNTTYSPEVPDVGLVAARLYEKVKNVAVDGAIVVDPRGIAALMPPGATVEEPRVGRLNADTLPEYIYSTAYEELGGPEVARRESLLDVGRDVFELLAQRGPGGVEQLDGVAEAVTAGHLRFVSFDTEEARLLDGLGASGSLPPSQDSVYINVQNQGPDKLDFWMRRSVAHRCSIESEQAICETTTSLRNEAPDGLTAYVSPRPNNEAEELLEIFVPGEAEVASVELDGQPAKVLRDVQGDRIALGVDIEVSSGEETTLRATYEIPLDGLYDLTVTPQPLAHDADLRVELSVPEGWTVDGPEGTEAGDLVFEHALDGTFRFFAVPTSRPGIPGIWDSLKDFWNDDVL